MKPVPSDYRRTSEPNAIALSDILQKYRTDNPDLALRKAANAGDSSEVECLLLDYHASPDHKSSNGFTALDWALQSGKLPKEIFQLLYHMQSSDSAAKHLIDKSFLSSVTDKNIFLADAIYRKDKADQTLLIDTFKADIYAAREIFMNTSYESESFHDQYIKKSIEFAAQEQAKAAYEATLRGYRQAFCEFKEHFLTENAGNLGLSNIMAGLQVSISAAVSKEMLALSQIASTVAQERICAEEDPRMGATLRMFKPFAAQTVVESSKKARPTQEKIIKQMMDQSAQHLSDTVSESLRYD